MLAFAPSVPLRPTSASIRRTIRLRPLCIPSRHRHARRVRSQPVARLAGNSLVKIDPYGMPVMDLPGTGPSPGTIRLIAAAVLAAILATYRWLRVRAALRKPYTRRNLQGDIAAFYDARSSAWESVWGEHMHHGLYDVVDGRRLSGSAAQVRTMDEMLRYSSVDLSACNNILDVGCGIGGASRYLAHKTGEQCRIDGMTLSPVQAARSTVLNGESKVSHRVSTTVRDVLDSGLDDASFDLIWSLESAEHIPEKQKFIRESKRLLKPNGEIIMLAWCVRECTTPFSTSEKFSIRRIMEEYCLPRVAAPSEYETELVRAGFRNVRHEDWTSRAAPFWWEVLRTAFFSRSGWRALWKNGWPLLRSAFAMRHVISGIRQGVFRLVVFSARVPTLAEVEHEEQSVLNC